MSRLVGVVLAVLTATLTLASALTGVVFLDGVRAERQVSRTIAVGSAPVLTVVAEVASISVVAGSPGEVVIEQKVNARGLTRRLAEQAVGLLESDATGGAAAVSVRPAGSFCCWSSLWVNDVGAALVIRIPPGASLSIEAAGGSVSISGLPSAGSIKVRSASGSVRISGPVRGGMDVQTSTGDIDIDLPSETNAHLDAGTQTGRVSVDPTWPVASSHGHASGTLGAGGSAIRLQSDEGNITVAVH